MLGLKLYPAEAPARYSAESPAGGYPVSGGKIARIGRYQFNIITQYSNLEEITSEL